MSVLQNHGNWVSALFSKNSAKGFVQQLTAQYPFFWPSRMPVFTCQCMYSHGHKYTLIKDKSLSDLCADEDAQGRLAVLSDGLSGI